MAVEIIDTASEPLDGRLVQTLLQSPVSDGGQWDMVVNLVEKYGLVPQKLYPDSFNAKSSARINWLITAKLREAALHIRALSAAAAVEATEKAPASESIPTYKAHILRDVQTILTLSLGVPPKPTDTFTWTYAEKDSKNVRTLTTTPLDFYRDNISAVSNPGGTTLFSPASEGVAARFSLVNDPRNSYMTLLTVKRLGNVYGARGIQYVNVPMDVMKGAVIAMLQHNHPVFFGCDVGKFSDSEKGIMDTALFDYNLGFNVSLGMNKAQRLTAGESSMTHAMVISGVNIENGNPTRWRVENSWGEQAGEKGYWVMSDKRMDEYCYQAVVSPEAVSEEVKKVLRQTPVELELWDPMGSLA